MVSVAQLVEPRIVIPVVVGSSPIVHPNSSIAVAIFLSNLFPIRLMLMLGISKNSVLTGLFLINQVTAEKSSRPLISQDE
jgi:hypothetical protein